jgi:ABC-2 type transport system ATP-binding protein
MSAELSAELRGVSHGYAATKGRTAWALRDISLEVAAGSVFGLLGPNGAGKTTTIKIISTLLLPTRGSVRVLGRDALRSPQQVRRGIGLVLGGERGLYDRLSGYDNLRYFAELYGMGGRAGAHRIAEVLSLVQLDGHERERVERYSRGMRQRLHIARGILHRPRLLLLDEPSIGVDPVGARHIRDLVREVNRRGTTVILTSHYMFEVEELADRIAIIDSGGIVAAGTVPEIRRIAKVGPVVEGLATGLDRTELDKVRRHPATDGLEVIEHDGRQRLIVRLRADWRPRESGLLDLLEALGVAAIVSRSPTLEDAYVQIVTKGTGDRDPGNAR